MAIVGQQDRAPGRGYQQEVDLVSLFKDVAHEFVHMATGPAQIRHPVDRAIRIALAERTVTCIIVPNDLQDMDAVENPPHEHGTIHSGVATGAPRSLPTQDDLQRAADVLNEGEKVAILVGAGALNATDEVIQVAGTLGAGVAKALLGRPLCPMTYPIVTGSIGLLGTEAELGVDDELRHAIDGWFELSVSEFLPEEGQARGVQIDISGRMVSMRYPMEVNLVGDSAATFRRCFRC